MDNESPIRLVRVTLDTNALPAETLIRDAGEGFDFAAVSVTAREVAGTSFEVHLEQLNTIRETGVFDESTWDNAVWAADDDPLERLLTVISGGSFPNPASRGSLTPGERRQLRDAMILSAHLRESRQIFVTDDRTAFIDNERREALQAEFSTQIMTVAEFRAFLVAHRNEAI